MATFIEQWTGETLELGAEVIQSLKQWCWIEISMAVDQCTMGIIGCLFSNKIYLFEAGEQLLHSKPWIITIDSLFLFGLLDFSCCIYRQIKWRGDNLSPCTMCYLYRSWSFYKLIYTESAPICCNYEKNHNLSSCWHVMGLRINKFMWDCTQNMLSFPQIQLKFRVQCSSQLSYFPKCHGHAAVLQNYKNILQHWKSRFQESQDFFITGKAVSRTADAYQDGSAWIICTLVSGAG